ncbi:DUF6397 family protein [Streptomyces sp. NPDC002018]|uniref:DUF6397 family protein n=1 Tax=Streptomyces sp. NPDC002018 TaxID=3364629 RepID=UPI003676E249
MSVSDAQGALSIRRRGHDQRQHRNRDQDQAPSRVPHGSMEGGPPKGDPRKGDPLESGGPPASGAAEGPTATAATEATAGAVRSAEKKPRTVGVVRAARELELKRGEFELAAQLGHIRTLAGPGAGRRQVSRQEIDRLRAAEGFPEALRERARTVGTAEGAELLTVSPGRFTRLARAGFIVPVRFYLNRYRAIVWLYPADEVRTFATREPALLTGRLPRPLRLGADPEEDRRPRTWRGRRIGHLLRESGDPWERAAVVGCVLDPALLAELVPDPHERAYVNRLRPDLAPGRPESDAARATVRPLLVAEHPDEIRWHRASLDTFLAEARRTRPAPRSDGPGEDGAPPRAERVPAPSGGDGRRGLLGRLRIGGERRLRFRRTDTISKEACSSARSDLSDLAELSGSRDGGQSGQELHHGPAHRA